MSSIRTIRDGDVSPLSVILPVVLCLFAISGCSQLKRPYPVDEDAFNGMYEQAQALEKKGDLVRAGEKYEEALAQKPDFPNLGKKIRILKQKIAESQDHYQAGLRYSENEQYDLAKKAFLKALEIYPKHPKAAEKLKSIGDFVKKSYILHRVEPGETMTKLAMLYYENYSEFKEIAGFNGLDEGALLLTGQEIRIPETENVSLNLLKYRQKQYLKTLDVPDGQEEGKAARDESMASYIPESDTEAPAQPEGEKYEVIEGRQSTFPEHHGDDWLRTRWGMSYKELQAVYDGRLEKEDETRPIMGFLSLLSQGGNKTPSQQLFRLKEDYIIEGCRYSLQFRLDGEGRLNQAGFYSKDRECQCHERIMERLHSIYGDPVSVSEEGSVKTRRILATWQTEESVVEKYLTESEDSKECSIIFTVRNP